MINNDKHMRIENRVLNYCEKLRIPEGYILRN